MTDNNGLISVIVPVYNVEKYLPECIESVLAQTYKNFELILVDDGSKDLSRDICERYAKKDNRVKIFYKENGGASSARNYGLKNIDGEYIYFLDSDDWLDKKAFEKLVDYSELHQADIVFFDAYTVDEETGEVSTKNYYHNGKYLPGTGFKLMGDMIRNKEFRVSPCLLFFRREYFAKEKFCFEEGIMYEDMIFAYQVFSQAKKVVYLSEFLYYRRYRKNSVMTSKKKKSNFDSAEKVYYKVKDYAIKTQTYENETTKLYMVRCSLNALNLFCDLSMQEQKDCKEAYRNLKKDIRKNHSYGDKALFFRTYGKVFWLIYKLYEKSIERMMKR